MTVQEVKKRLQALHYRILHNVFCNKVHNAELEALNIAIESTEELEQYRALGTVEELKNQKHNLSVAYKCIEELQQKDWIHCEVDMPKEEYGTYWIAVEQEGLPYYYYCSAVYTSKDGFRTQDIEAQGKVVAWQPIQPYKKEGAE